jgi:hypothetical protein
MTEVLQHFIELAEDLDRNAVIISKDEFDPVAVVSCPEPWRILGCGNYAAVFAHPLYKDYVVKIYGRAVQGIKDEIEVYGRLGSHPAYSECH